MASERYANTNACHKNVPHHPIKSWIRNFMAVINMCRLFRLLCFAASHRNNTITCARAAAAAPPVQSAFFCSDLFLAAGADKWSRTMRSHAEINHANNVAPHRRQDERRRCRRCNASSGKHESVPCRNAMIKGILATWAYWCAPSFSGQLFSVYFFLFFLFLFF